MENWFECDDCGWYGKVPRDVKKCPVCGCEDLTETTLSEIKDREAENSEMDKIASECC